MRRDLLKIVAEHDATTQMVILTHNIEFLFVESLLLTAARKAGTLRLRCSQTPRALRGATRANGSS